MEPPQGIAWSKNIEDCDHRLQDAWPLLQDSYQKETNKLLSLTCTWRSVQSQQDLWKQGRIEPGPPCWHDGAKRPIGSCVLHPFGLCVTWIDGIDKLSEHNHFPSRAFDVVVGEADPLTQKVRVSWDVELYKPLVRLAGSFGLESGGGWSDGHKDWPHIQLPKEAV